ncbi:hypothetical protein CWATWH8502_371 [Crocosphaera watsonii WH 8502]|uniref:Uncharacterized protein n=1 Tax=Crocosphaera watsonii WH 8502 TaxID=423474 RepID=T2IAX5_CROWT|nr:hypothetical protein CWATWH8502_371 [Crocosphaera watsonii WH 8502]
MIHENVEIPPSVPPYDPPTPLIRGLGVRGDYNSLNSHN